MLVHLDISKNKVGSTSVVENEVESEGLSGTSGSEHGMLGVEGIWQRYVYGLWTSPERAHWSKELERLLSIEWGQM